MTDDSDYTSSGRARRSKILDFTGDPTDHPAWLYSVRLQALAAQSDDVLDDFDNPYKRGRRTANTTAPRNGDDADGEAFAEEGEEVTLAKESPTEFAATRTSWSKRRNALFADLAASLKGTTGGLAQLVKTGDVLGLLALVAENHGDSTEASRYALIMDLILLRLDAVALLDAHIASFNETKRRLAALDPPENFTAGAETCLFLHSLSTCDEMKGVVGQALLREKRGGALSWRAGTQAIVAHSSTEAELIALDEACRELHAHGEPAYCGAPTGGRWANNKQADMLAA